MHDQRIRADVIELSRAGLNDCEVARRTELPRSTVRDIRRAASEPTRRSLTGGPRCPRCWAPTRPIRVDPSDYLFLLGLYLGDGHIVRSGRTFRLRIFMDAKYTVVCNEVRDLLGRCFPDNRVLTQSLYDGTMEIISVYSKHLPCLLPQHGPGRKHDRMIRLEDWQEDLITSAPPWGLIKGLIWSDGSTFVNHTGKYSYPSYQFSNKSRDIVEIFKQAVERVGVAYRVNTDNREQIYVRMNRRESVALLDEHVGLKR